MQHLRIWISSFAFLLLVAWDGHCQLTGKVVSIADGDTFTLLVENGEQVRVRLYRIDCPEKGQDFSNKAKEFLAEQVFNKEVVVDRKGLDRYGRTIGLVKIDGTTVNEKLLEAGLAWHYRQYDANPEWAKIEAEARASKRGLWMNPSPIPPWEYRKGVR